MTWLRRWFGWRCRWGMCPTKHYEDEEGSGGQCVDCGKVVGYLTNEELRAMLDRTKP
jgi:hypothetical protein